MNTLNHLFKYLFFIGIVFFRNGAYAMQQQKNNPQQNPFLLANLQNKTPTTLDSFCSSQNQRTDGSLSIINANNNNNAMQQQQQQNPFIQTNLQNKPTTDNPITLDFLCSSQNPRIGDSLGSINANNNNQKMQPQENLFCANNNNLFGQEKNIIKINKPYENLSEEEIKSKIKIASAIYSLQEDTIKKELIILNDQIKSSLQMVDKLSQAIGFVSKSSIEMLAIYSCNVELESIINDTKAIYQQHSSTIEQMLADSTSPEKKSHQGLPAKIVDAYKSQEYMIEKIKNAEKSLSVLYKMQNDLLLNCKKKSHQQEKNQEQQQIQSGNNNKNNLPSLNNELDLQSYFNQQKIKEEKIIPQASQQILSDEQKMLLVADQWNKSNKIKIGYSSPDALFKFIKPAINGNYYSEDTFNKRIKPLIQEIEREHSKEESKKINTQEELTIKKEPEKPLPVFYYLETNTNNNNNPVSKFISDSFAKEEITQIKENIKKLSTPINLSKKLTKKMEGMQDIWELRVLLPQHTIRFLYIIFENKVILLHGFIKKDDKTSMNDKEAGVRRHKNVLNKAYLLEEFN
jgi:phage-related protein